MDVVKRYGESHAFFSAIILPDFYNQFFMHKNVNFFQISYFKMFKIVL